MHCVDGSTRFVWTYVSITKNTPNDVLIVKPTLPTVDLYLRLLAANGPWFKRITFVEQSRQLCLHQQPSSTLLSETPFQAHLLNQQMSTEALSFLLDPQYLPSLRNLPLTPTFFPL